MPDFSEKNETADKFVKDLVTYILEMHGIWFPYPYSSSYENYNKCIESIGKAIVYMQAHYNDEIKHISSEIYCKVFEAEESRNDVFVHNLLTFYDGLTNVATGKIALFMAVAVSSYVPCYHSGFADLINSAVGAILQVFELSGGYESIVPKLYDYVEKHVINRPMSNLPPLDELLETE